MLEKIKDGIAGFLSREGFELVDLSLKKRRHRPTLAIFVERANRQEGGVSLDECARLNQEIGEVLDRENLVTEPYLLEVSSPGLDRPLASDADFRRCQNQRVKLVTLTGRVYLGRIKDVDPEAVTIENNNGEEIKVLRQDIARAKLDFEI